ncbi:hypothetical protein HDU93_007019 [Gonapodya sp. JEL0774]|nr:hypothetical protein HDU93_007019 [Gonapodya sp. JEL0774]
MPQNFSFSDLIALARETAQHLDPNDDLIRIRTLNEKLKLNQSLHAAALSDANALIQKITSRKSLLQSTLPSPPSPTAHSSSLSELLSTSESLASSVASLEDEVAALDARMIALTDEMKTLEKELADEEEAVVDPGIIKLRIYKELGFTLSSSTPPTPSTPRPPLDRATVISRTSQGPDVNSIDLSEGRSEWYYTQVMWDLAGGWGGR